MYDWLEYLTYLGPIFHSITYQNKSVIDFNCTHKLIELRMRASWGETYLEIQKLHAILLLYPFLIVIPQIYNQKTPTIPKNILSLFDFLSAIPTTLQFCVPTHPLFSGLPTVYTSAVKQIATIQSALKPNTASTVPVSSVSPVGSVGTELPWLASASLLLETQPPWA